MEQAELVVRGSVHGAHHRPAARRRLARRSTPLLALSALLLAACGGTSGTAAPASVIPPEIATASSTTAPSPAPTDTTVPPAPPATAPPLSPFTGDPFFDPGAAPAGAPGEIIRSRPVATGLEGAQAWQVLYWSRTAEDRPVAVSATVVAPASPSSGPRPVLAWAHPTTGLGDQCAPSAQLAQGRGIDLALFPLILQRGWTIVETDYQGLGTPGDHAYLVGQSEGRNVLDSVRAAARVEGSGVAPASKVIVWGHSQGGAAAAFTAELQPTYAPDVDLVGAIAGAPPAELDRAGQAGADPAYGGFVPMAVVGLRAGYPELAADDTQLTAEGRQTLTEVSAMCVSDALDAFEGKDLSALFAAGALDRPDWQAALDANRAGDRPTSVPIFIYHGSDDDLVPPELSARLLDRYCAHGVTALRKVYPGTNHGSVVPAALGDISAYAQARLDGEPAPTSCP